MLTLITLKKINGITNNIKFSKIRLNSALNFQRGLRGAAANVLDSNIVVSKFEFQLHNYVHFRTYTLRKAWASLSPNSGLDNATTILVQG